MTFRVLFCGLALVLFSLSARADLVTVKGREKAIKGPVKTEDAKNVVVTVGAGAKAKVETIPSVDVIDIVYDDAVPLALAAKYTAAMKAEQNADTDDADKRKTALATAITSYTELLKTMKRDTTAQKNAARHFEYKVAVLILKSGTDQVTIDRGVKRLQEFADLHKDSWQINHVMPMLAEIQMNSGDWKEAEKTFQRMSEMTVFSPEARREAELMVVTVAVRSKDIERANKLLDALEKKAGGNPAFASRIKMARAEVFVGLKQFDKAIPLLQEIVKTSTDKQTKALAHNALGESLFKEKKFNEAMWEFLWVDTIYNQDRNQHAKALYFLWKTFEQLNNAERAQECREMLLDRQFIGTEHQKLALAQGK